MFSLHLFVALVNDVRLGSCLWSGPKTSSRNGKGLKLKGYPTLTVGSWIGKYIELVKILKKRNINIACV